MNALINVAIPVFGIVLTGYLAGKLRILGDASATAVNAFVYYFALPALLFLFTAQASLDEIIHFPFISVFLFGTLATIGVAALGARFLFRLDAKSTVVHAMTAGFSNTAYMGIPIFLTAFGRTGTLPAIIATIAANTLVIGAGIAALELLGKGAGQSRSRIMKTLRSLATNPLLISPLLGLSVAAAGVAIPTPVTNYLDLLGSAAGPSALFALGLALSAQAFRIAWGEVVWLTSLKLVIQPLVTLTLIVYVFPLPAAWMEGALILSALPTGALVYVVAQQYNTYAQTSSAAIVVSTAVSVVTVSLILIGLGIN